MLSFRIFIVAIVLGSLFFALSARRHKPAPEHVAPQHFWTDQVRTPPVMRDARTLGHFTTCHDHVAELWRGMTALRSKLQPSESLAAMSVRSSDDGSCYEDWIFAVREDRLVPPK